MPCKRLRFVSVWTLLGLFLAACQPQIQTVVTIVPRATVPVVVTAAPTSTAPSAMGTKPSGPKVLRGIFPYGDIPTLDPALASGAFAVDLIEELTVGLARQNEVTTALDPGMAGKWEYDAAKNTYTFHIRTDVPWVKYDAKTGKVIKVQDDKGQDRMVTARDFSYGILRTLDPKTASDYAYVLTTIISNAAAFNSGALTDAPKVGVKALDDATLVVTLEPGACVPCAANILGLWVAHAQPQWLIEQKKDRWIEMGNLQSYGPYALKEWIHDVSLTLVKNPFWPGSPSVPQPKIDEIYVRMLGETAALSEYEAGNLDVTSVPLSDMDRVKADARLSKELRISPALCTAYYGFKVQVPPTDDVRVRLALSEAIDRQDLVDHVLKGGQEPAQWFARPGLAAAPTLDKYPDLGVKYDPAGAKKLLQSYLDEKKLAPARLEITLMYFSNEVYKRLSEAIAQMWQETLGITVHVINLEAKAYMNSIQPAKADLNVFWLAWCQDYPDANNFDKEVFNSQSGQNNTNWSNADFDRITNQAAVETDPAKRVQLYAQAEDILVKQDAAITPIYWYTAATLTKPTISRTYSVLGGMSHWEKWDISQ